MSNRTAKRNKNITLLTHQCTTGKSESNQTAKRNKNITLGTLNVRGLGHKVHEVSDLLAQENLDMLFLTETLLSAEVGNGELRIDGGIGEDEEVLQFISGKKLSVFSAHVPNTPVPVKLELLFVELDLQNVKLLMGCLYCPPSATVEYTGIFWRKNLRLFCLPTKNISFF